MARCAAGGGETMTFTQPPTFLTVHSSNQEVLSQKLMNELREVANKPEYQNMYFSTTIGVLEMLKMELYESITP
jgi:hypothetical protein